MEPSTSDSVSTGTGGRQGSRTRKNPVLMLVGSASNLGGDRVVVPLGDQVTVGRSRGLARRASSVVVDDPLVSRSHAKIVRTSRGYDLVDLGGRNGTIVDGNLVRDTTIGLTDGALLFFGGQAAAFHFLADEDLVALHDERGSPFTPVGTLSPRVARMARTLRTLAPTGDVLLVGESGVGKEVYAHALHIASRRSGQLFAVNCAALPRDLFESELFGYARGAHSQAVAEKAGLARQAEGGTLFFDELGAMPVEILSNVVDRA